MSNEQRSPDRPQCCQLPWKSRYRFRQIWPCRCSIQCLYMGDTGSEEYVRFSHLTTESPFLRVTHGKSSFLPAPAPATVSSSSAWQNQKCGDAIPKVHFCAMESKQVNKQFASQFATVC